MARSSRSRGNSDDNRSFKKSPGYISNLRCRLTADPRESKNGAAVFARVAANSHDPYDEYEDEDGTPFFFEIRAFRPQSGNDIGPAHFLSTRQKGDQLLVSGPVFFKYEEWEDKKTGKKRHETTLIIEVSQGDGAAAIVADTLFYKGDEDDDEGSRRRSSGRSASGSSRRRTARSSRNEEPEEDEEYESVGEEDDAPAPTRRSSRRRRSVDTIDG